MANCAFRSFDCPLNIFRNFEGYNFFRSFESSSVFFVTLMRSPSNYVGRIRSNLSFKVILKVNKTKNVKSLLIWCLLGQFFGGKKIYFESPLNLSQSLGIPRRRSSNLVCSCFLSSIPFYPFSLLSLLRQLLTPTFFFLKRPWENAIERRKKGAEREERLLQYTHMEKAFYVEQLLKLCLQFGFVFSPGFGKVKGFYLRNTYVWRNISWNIICISFAHMHVASESRKTCQYKHHTWPFSCLSYLLGKRIFRNFTAEGSFFFVFPSFVQWHIEWKSGRWIYSSLLPFSVFFFLSPHVSPPHPHPPFFLLSLFGLLCLCVSRPRVHATAMRGPWMLLSSPWSFCSIFVVLSFIYMIAWYSIKFWTINSTWLSVF